MTIQWLIGAFAVIFSAGVAWGVVKTSQKNSDKRVLDVENKLTRLEENFRSLSDTGKIVRGYLFGPDGRTYYVPVKTCTDNHLKADNQLKDLSKRSEEQFKELNKKVDRLLESLIKDK